MSEKLNLHSPEGSTKHETEHSNSEHEKQLLKEHHEKAKKSHEVSKDTIESIKHSIENEAIDKSHYQVGEKETKQTHDYTASKHLKKQAYKQTLKQVQKNLSKPEKTFSKVIHNKTIEKVSDVGSKTVARPSGLLFGGIFAFISSLLVLLISKHSGFTYNYLLFVLVFVGGYFLGLIFELFYRFLKLGKK